MSHRLLYYPFAGASAAVVPASTLLTGLLAWWGMDQAAGAAEPDLTGAGHTLTSVNTVGSGAGPLGTDLARSFVAASNQFFSLSSPVVLPGSWTVSKWCLFSGSAGAIWGNAATTGSASEMQFNGATLLQWENDANVGFFNMALSPAFPASTWCHMLTTFDGTTAKCYVNNTQVGSGAFGPGTSTMAAIGSKSKTGAVNPFAGSMAKMGVWSRVATATERGELYNAGVPTAYPFTGLP